MKIEYFEIDVTEAAYEQLKGTGPFLLTVLGERSRGEAIGMLETLPDLDAADYAKGYGRNRNKKKKTTKA